MARVKADQKKAYAASQAEAGSSKLSKDNAMANINVDDENISNVNPQEVEVSKSVENDDKAMPNINVKDESDPNVEAQANKSTKNEDQTMMTIDEKCQKDPNANFETQEEVDAAKASEYKEEAMARMNLKKKDSVAYFEQPSDVEMSTLNKIFNYIKEQTISKIKVLQEQIDDNANPIEASESPLIYIKDQAIAKLTAGPSSSFDIMSLVESDANKNTVVKIEEVNFPDPVPRKSFEFVGLKNQGATCYMNSVLQTLYFTNALRKALHKMPIESRSPSECVAFALQRIFFDLQYSDKAVETKHLTNSFGWDEAQSFRQHDVQEFLRTLLETLEIKMRGTEVEGTIPRLFRGEMNTYIKCKYVDYESTRTESFYDIQLNIKGKKNLQEAFSDYVKAEVLDGDNKYDAGGFGLQEAQKGVVFTRFPPVLHLHLMRFQYDPVNNCSMKFNDRFEFSEKLDLSEYIKSDDETCCTYTLQTVLVHIGFDNAGHYIVYIDPNGNGKWHKFNDDKVTKCSKSEAIQENYGLSEEDSKNVPRDKSFSAYMLVYIKDSELSNVLEKVTIQDIPRLHQHQPMEKKIVKNINLKKCDIDLRLTVKLLLEDSFELHSGYNLYNPKTAKYMVLEINKSITVDDFIEVLIEKLNYPAECMRLWPIHIRAPNVIRPISLNIGYGVDRKISDIVKHERIWNVFLELLPADSKQKHLPPFDDHWDVLLFFKMYDPRITKMCYCGLHYASIHSFIAALIPILNERGGFPCDTELDIYVEVSPGRIEFIVDPKNTSIRRLRNGDILLYQKKVEFEDEYERYPLPTCQDYLRNYFYRMDILFSDKSMANDPEFILELSGYMSYDQMAKAVALFLHTEPCNLRFFKVSKDRLMGPGLEIRSDFKGPIEQLCPFGSFSLPTIFYERLRASEKKVPFKVTFVKSNFVTEDEEVILFVRHNATVADLIEEAKKTVQMACDGSGILRLLDVKYNRINTIGHKQCILDPTKSYRIEEIPKDEVGLSTDEALVPVSHFYRNVNRNFGTPFLVKITTRDTISSLKEKVFKKACIQREIFQELEIAVIYAGKPISITENISVKIGGRSTDHPKVWIGINHDY